jgi:hypothetical protein
VQQLELQQQQNQLLLEQQLELAQQLEFQLEFQ